MTWCQIVLVGITAIILGALTIIIFLQPESCTFVAFKVQKRNQENLNFQAQK